VSLAWSKRSARRQVQTNDDQPRAPPRRSGQGQKLQTALQTGDTVPLLSQAKGLILLVVCAVICEPVSKPNSLVSGNFTGNLAILGLSGANFVA
jgi:hypothetical protein